MPADKKTLMESIRNIFVAAKAMPEGVEDIEDVMDLWTEDDGQFRVPSEQEIKTGPSEASSGDGAFKMVGEYSHPAPQTVITESYDRFSRMLEKMARTMKSVQSRQAVLESVLFEAAKSAPATAVTADKDTYLGKAESRLKLARMALRKADMADEDEKEEREEEMEKANRALTAAKRLLSKAEHEAEEKEDEDEAEKVEKALGDYRKLSKAFAKAKTELTKAEDEREKRDYEDEKKRVESKERDDKEEMKRIEAREHEREHKKAEDEREKEDEKEDEHKKSNPDRLKMLETTVEGLLATVANTSKYGPLPDFMKSMPAESIADKIDEAIDSGRIREDVMVMKAKDLHSRLIAAKNGNYDPSRLQADIAAAPDVIRDLFKTAA